MRAKTKFHAEQLKVEIAHLKILTSYSFYCINKMKLELKYIQGLEETRDKEANILRAIHKQQQSICHYLHSFSNALNKPLTISDFDSNDDVIAKWVATNPEYLPHFVSVSTKQSSRFVMLVNQVLFTAPTKHTVGRLGGAIAVISVGSVGGNGVGFGGGTGASELGGTVAIIDMGSVRGNSVGSGSGVGVSLLQRLAQAPVWRLVLDVI